MKAWVFYAMCCKCEYVGWFEWFQCEFGMFCNLYETWNGIFGVFALSNFRTLLSMLYRLVGRALSSLGELPKSSLDESQEMVYLMGECQT